MLWINTSGDTLNFIMDIGKGRTAMTVLPYQTIEIPEKYSYAIDMEAPQLAPYKPEVSNEPQLQIVQIEDKPAPKKRGPKSKAKAN